MHEPHLHAPIQQTGQHFQKRYGACRTARRPGDMEILDIRRRNPQTAFHNGHFGQHVRVMFGIGNITGGHGSSSCI